MSCGLNVNLRYLESNRNYQNQATETKSTKLTAALLQEPQFYWMNTVLDNLKSVLRSTYYSFQPK